MDANNGRLELIIGPMFSGKSTELQRRIRRHTLAGERCCILKFAGDTRYDALAGAASVATHDGRAAAALPVSRLADAEALVAAAAVVGVDEAQFFDDVAERAEAWANAGKHVILAGLDATFHRTGFAGVLALIPRAEAVTKLTAVCTGCGADAAFTRRTVSDAAAASGDASVANGALIGGAEAYAAVCRSCYFAPAPPRPIGAAAAEAAAAAAAAEDDAEMAAMAPPPPVAVGSRRAGGAQEQQGACTPPHAQQAAEGAFNAAKKARGNGGNGNGAKRAFGAAAAPLTEGLSRLELASSPMSAHGQEGRGQSSVIGAGLRSMR